MARVIKKQAPFDGELARAVPDAVRRQEIEQGIRFALSEFPGQGVRTGRSTPMPVYIWRMFKTNRNSPLVIYYCFDSEMVLLLGVRVAQEDPEDEESPRSS